MTFDEYQKAALRTASDGKGVNSEMCIRALGLCGESRELEMASEWSDFQETEKEAGDVLWYVATLAASFGLDGFDLGVDELSDVPTAWHIDAAIGVTRSSCRLAEIVKKHVGHGKEANRVAVSELLFDVLRGLASVTDLEQAAVKNIAKLKERYPAGFDLKIASAKSDSDEPKAAAATVGAVSVDADGRSV